MLVSLPTLGTLVVMIPFAVGYDNSSRLAERFLVDGNTVTVSVDPNHSGNMVNERYLSVTIDSYELTVNMKRFHASSNKFRNVAKALAPAYMRVGGTLADSIVFRDHYGSFTVMGQWELDTLYNFARSVGWEMIFDLNLQTRHNGQWDSSNAEKLMRYAASKGYQFHLELGNEPNVYHQSKHVDPAQIGRDYGKLKQLMQSISPFNNKMLLGPAVENHVQESFAQQFLTTGAGYITAFTLHQFMRYSIMFHFYHGEQRYGRRKPGSARMNSTTIRSYYFSGKDAAPEKYQDPHVLNTITDSINRIWEAMRKSNKHMPLWLGETSSAYSKAPDSTTGFIHGFMWLDKLGMAGVHGINVVMRQTFINLVDQNDNPVPDFWLSLLFKRLVGRRVLHVTSSENNYKVRIYAHCSAERSHPHGVTFFLANLYGSDVHLTIPQYRQQNYHLYALTPGGNGALNSNAVRLNGHDLHLNGDNVPNLSPVTSRNWPINIPRHSMAFVVIPDANAPICR